MRRMLTITAAAALIVAGAGTTAFADAVTSCAAAQGKAVIAFTAALFKEISRACGKGSAGAPLEVSQAAVGAMAGKLYTALGKAVDKNGDTVCALTLDDAVNTTPPDKIIDAIRLIAGQACLVP